MTRLLETKLKAIDLLIEPGHLGPGSLKLNLGNKLANRARRLGIRFLETKLKAIKLLIEPGHLRSGALKLNLKQ